MDLGRENFMNAHSVSLPLYHALESNTGKPVNEALDSLLNSLRLLSLIEDIQPIIVFGKVTCIDLQPETDLGRSILGEVRARSEFLPCPEEECEYDSSGCCRWCGTLK